ncbi:uncharacterized protein LOC111269712 [Varroa jacobsoni]|uniref:Uncharacterized protein n=1 Tax=Varroa destructor TaxID=109461 RepID=A0A7M7JGF1_VARDE|nr:uncharacterized protein LOC111246299 [Varroa destructor]XP_022651389.1 uncharacterized protein LOC111246299 [Varroa destructor]XP_022651390.1 uncharacterized protein LOC111246299 [Varroa destructor]XP_022705251.1 uncharacterized protein LOC111269712 [Varroa jacobsoni]
MTYGSSGATMWILRCGAVLIVFWCCTISRVQANPRCLLAEQERAAFMGELLKEAQTGSGGLQQAHELRRLVHSVLDNNSWRELLQSDSSDYSESDGNQVPGVRFRIMDATGQQLIPEEFMPLSTDTIVHFVMEFRKVVLRKYGDLIRYWNNAQRGCFGVSRIGESKPNSAQGAWKIVVQTGEGKIVADDSCIPKDMRLWDKYIVSFRKIA